MSFSLTKWVGTSAVAGISAITVFSSTASAFFPPLPTGSVSPPTVAPIVSPPPTAVVPPSPVSPIKPVSPPPFVPPPISPPPVDPDCHCHPHPPACVPEPATIITGAIGLTVMGVGALRRKLGKKDAKTEA